MESRRVGHGWARVHSQCSRKRQRPVQKRVEHRRMPDVARLCEVVKSHGTPHASECVRKAPAD